MENTEKKSDQEILNEFAIKYQKEMKKYETSENLLVGNFDEKNEYKILDIIVKELIALQKLIEFKDEKEYKATATVNKVKLNFVVTLEDLPENKKSATLKLIEEFVVAKIYKSTISTQLAKYVDNNSDNFLFNVRKAFHLVSKEELNGKVDIKNYVSPPIELYTELKKKHDYFSLLNEEREALENKYISTIFKILKSTKNGSAVLKKFVAIVKANDLDKNTVKKFLIFRQILDKIIDEESAQNKFEIADNLKIKDARTEFLEEIKKIEKNFQQEQEGILGKSTLKAKNPSKSASKSKGGGSSGGSSGGGSKGGGGGGGSKGGDSKKDKGKDKGKDNSLFGAEFFEGLRNKIAPKKEPEKVQPPKEEKKVVIKNLKPANEKKEEESLFDQDFDKLLGMQLDEISQKMSNFLDQKNEDIFDNKIDNLLMEKENKILNNLLEPEEIEIKLEEPAKLLDTLTSNRAENPKKFVELKKFSEKEQNKNL